ncbi:MAG: PilZ domain protein [Smithella sp. PtaU1.Bin162]|nr:MAG: PilZ domain protein [Smithella sp. PtaU1.Bin162]
MDNQDIKSMQNQREYSRVDVFIPVEYKLLEPQQRQHVRSRVAGETILAEFKSLPDPDDQLIAEWLKTINTKLNSIIRMLTMHQEGFNQLTMRKVNISGGGICFSADKPYSQGDILEFKVTLTMQYPMSLFLYGEVIETSKHNPEYNTSVQFIAIDDFVRDEIIKFVFEKEREILREKRR